MSDVIIRPVRPEDAEGTIRLVSIIAQEGAYFLVEPQELRSVEVQRKLIEEHDPNVVGWFVAEVDGQIVGQIDARRKGLARVRHTAELGIGLLPDWRGQGIGERLMRRIEEWAREVGVEKLQLGVFASNTRAKRLYEKLGYEQEGYFKGQVKIGDRYEDEVLMAKWVK
jgi:RimJ/RimL family protein N-acetyltransferase